MAETNDTIDGLLAEFRGYAAGMPPSYHVTMSWHDFRVMLDRFEAAHRRERGDAAKLREADHNWDAICEKCLEGEPPDECRYYGEPCGCNSPMYGEHPKPFGENAAVLRSAIIEILLEMEDMAGLEVGRKYKFSPDAMVQQCRDALAAPMRNCDRFKTAAEAIDAYQDLTGDQLATDSGMKEWVEFAVWLFAPATEKEGGAK